MATINKRKSLKHFLPLHLDITKQALDGNNLYLTQVKDKARFSCGLQYPIASCFLPSADAGQFAYKHPSQATVEEPLLSTEDRCNSGVEQVL